MEVRALLLTDVVDSTKLVEALGDARAAEVWTAHDRVARDLLGPWRGHEVDRTDGFLLMFAEVADAVGYAVAYHAALRTLAVPLLARAGIHVGPVLLRENPAADVARGAKPIEVEGVAKPLAARVMSLAVGGQTLLSEVARAALGKTALRVESRGHWRLKGLAQPVELFEVGDDAAPFVPPPDAAKAYQVVERDDLWVPRREIRKSLPAEPDAFVGREADLQAIAKLFDDGARLVTLLGPGGTGKTRLSRRFAWTWLGDYPGGAWFVDLADARDADAIAGAVARTLDVPLVKGDVVDQLGHAIAGREACLVVLDNFEQITAHAAMVGRWLQRAGEAVFLVTSRERLGVRGEHVLALEPLDVDAGVRLFEVRARAQDANFAVTPENRADVAAIVSTLDGLPLAIELAAARIRLLRPAQLRERLKERFKVLAGARGVAARQATLRAAIDWSWDLLAPWERAALAQLSVFEGSFLLEATESVLDLGPEAPLAMDAVQALVDKSLVRVQSDRGEIAEPWLGLYVSIHEYAAEKLRTSGAFPGSGPEGELAAQERHGRHFARQGSDEAIDAMIRQPDGVRAQELDLDDFVVACKRAVARGDAAVAAGNARAACAVIELQGPHDAGLRLVEPVLAMALSDPDRARVAEAAAVSCLHSGRATRGYLEMGLACADARFAPQLRARLGLVILQDDPEAARRMLEQALAEARAVGSDRAIAMATGNLGMCAYVQGRLDDARALHRAAAEAAARAGDVRQEAMYLTRIASDDTERGRPAEAEVHLERLLVMARRLGDRRLETTALCCLGGVGFVTGRLDDARAHLEIAVAIARETGDRRQEGLVLGNIGATLFVQHRYGESRRFHEAALAIARELGARGSEVVSLGNVAETDCRDGHLDDALAHMDEALAICRAIGDRRWEGITVSKRGRIYEAKGDLDAALRDLVAGEAVLREVRDGYELAIAIASRGEVDFRRGDVDGARAALSDAEAIAAPLGVRPESRVAEAIAALKARLSDVER